ncbi:MAG: helix-turn-helix domain-containing protein [Bacteroidales bacterium]|nr:helix-turn-helix domain-containing protein [Candidatus Colicola faecequi]
MNQSSALSRHAELHAILQIPAGELKEYLDEDRKRTFDEGFRKGLEFAELSRKCIAKPLTKSEAATALGVSIRTIERMRMRGDLESIDGNGTVRFERSEIERYKRTHSSLAASITTN